MKIKAAVLREVKKPLSIEELELAPPKANEVLVKVAYTGFCHSDLHTMLGDSPGVLPIVMGHETAGVVEDVGPGVTKVKKGDRVITAWMVSCGQCSMCRQGIGNVCLGNYGAVVNGTLLDGTTRLTDKDGKKLQHFILVAGFATHTVCPEGGVIPIPKEFPLEQACLLGCGVTTGFGAINNRAKVRPGDSVAVYGVGGIGLNAIRAASLALADPVIAIDIEGSKEGLAREFGATHFINSSKEDPVPKIQELTGGGANVVVEAIGDPGSYIQAFWSLGMAGKLIAVGVMPADKTGNFPMIFLTFQEKSILGSLYGSVCSLDTEIPKLVKLAMKGHLKLDKLVTKKFRLNQINDVAETMAKHQIQGRWVCEMD